MDGVTTSNKVKKRRFSKWACGSAWMASVIPWVIFTALVTTTWFVLFWVFDSTFSKLWPVAEWLWLLPTILFVPVAANLILLNIFQDWKRARLFAHFCATCLSEQGSNPIIPHLPLMYVYYNRDRRTALASLNLPSTSQQTVSSIEPHSQMTKALRDVGNAELMRLWLASCVLEKQKRNIALNTFVLGAAWLHCFSLPFLFWSYYNWFGYFGCLLIQWPILAVAHIGTKKINYFASHTKPQSWFLTVNYEAMAQRCKRDMEQ